MVFKIDLSEFAAPLLSNVPEQAQFQIIWAFLASLPVMLTLYLKSGRFRQDWKDLHDQFFKIVFVIAFSFTIYLASALFDNALQNVVQIPSYQAITLVVSAYTALSLIRGEEDEEESVRITAEFTKVREVFERTITLTVVGLAWWMLTTLYALAQNPQPTNSAYHATVISTIIGVIGAGAAMKKLLDRQKNYWEYLQKTSELEHEAERIKEEKGLRTRDWDEFIKQVKKKDRKQAKKLLEAYEELKTLTNKKTGLDYKKAKKKAKAEYKKAKKLAKAEYKKAKKK